MRLETLLDLDTAVMPCPACDRALAPTAVRVAGLAIVVDARCPSCDRAFAYDWPAGHALLHPALVDRTDVTLQDLALLGQGLTPTPAAHDGAAPLRIGFSLREDRLWLGPPRLWVKVARHLLPSRLTHNLLLQRQHRSYARLARRIRERHPEARFIAFGIGQPRGLPAYIEDLRTPDPIREELPWLDDYRSCRVIVGVHGANLLLPSLLAGAVVDLLPAFKLLNINQDLIIPHDDRTEPKLALFRYRIVPEECSPDSVAAVALSVIDHAAGHHRNMIENRRAYDTPGWTRPNGSAPLEDADAPLARSN